jgi:hypothetical protein
MRDENMYLCQIRRCRIVIKGLRLKNRLQNDRLLLYAGIYTFQSIQQRVQKFLCRWSPKCELNGRTLLNTNTVQHSQSKSSHSVSYHYLLSRQNTAEL